ncbi:nucleobase:cation symporter-2 family protein [Allokutzneria albata]|uniref:nucleobase:cation symporter-2 family protein n=1 Tax=Allokutzneria albata TaxID=211114 RepID=UPI000ABC9D43|nr:nucleobase:cation symporter-2 family protein [Allokutzneria albata]
MTHQVDEVPRPGPLVALGLQHVLAMYAGAVAVPLILGNAMRLSTEDIAYLINADLLVSGAATILQCVGVWRFGARLPLMQGCTFAAVTPMVLIGTQGGGLPAIYGAVIVGGLVLVLFAPVFGRLVRFFPPLVTGTVILIIGLSLLPVAVDWAAGGTDAADHGAPKHLALALGVLLFVLVLQRFGRGFVGRVAVLVGLVVGTLVAIPLGYQGFSEVGTGPLFAVSTPFHFGLPVFELTAIVSIAVVMLVTMAETTGDVLAIGEIVRQPVDGRRVADTLRADGLSTALGGVFNTFPYTAFAQNVGLVRLTRVHSRYVVAAGGAILALLGLVPALGRVVAAIPAPVLGGAGVAMFGAVAASGVQTLSQVSFTGNGNLAVVAASLGVGLAPVFVPTLYEQFPTWFQIIAQSGISVGCLAAVGLNLLFNGPTTRNGGVHNGLHSADEPR